MIAHCFAALRKPAQRSSSIWVRSFAIVLLIVAHTILHVHAQETQEQQPGQLLPMITPELVNQLRVLLSQTSVTEEQPETPQLAETTTGTEEHESQPVTLLPSITQEEQEKVIAAYTQGISKRKICSHLHWGSSKYTTIVKPVLDAYLQQKA